MDDFPHVELRTPRLHLTTDAAYLEQVAQEAALGVHHPDAMPFGNPWTDTTPDGRAQSVIDWWTTKRDTWDPGHWCLPFIVLHNGHPIGIQDVHAQHYRILRTVHTGSWLGLRHHRQGFGTEMRAAVLHFAFAALGARYAMTGAHDDNAGSNGVSRKLGYQHNGFRLGVMRGEPVTVLHYVLDAPTWAQHASHHVEVEWLDTCATRFGAPAPGHP